MTYSADISSSHPVFVRAVRRNRLLLTIIGLHAFVGVVLGAYLGQSFLASTAPKILGVFKTLSMFMAANYLLWRLAVAMFKVKPRKPIQWMIGDLKAMLADRDRTADAVIAFSSVLILIVTFTFLKDIIPLINFFSWDPFFAHMDRVVHGGQDAWTLLWPVLGSPYLTTAINAAYHGWFALIYLAVCLACIDRRDPNRCTVFLVAFALCWAIGGNLLATVFASVGPVFYQAFGYGDTFVPQLELLQRSHEVSPVWALEWHQMLLDGYFNDGPVNGISAMPSMHVASSVLLALYGFTYSRLLGWALTVFTGVILLGSVHLAWQDRKSVV